MGCGLLTALAAVSCSSHGATFETVPLADSATTVQIITQITVPSSPSSPELVTTLAAATAPPTTTLTVTTAADTAADTAPPTIVDTTDGTMPPAVVDDGVARLSADGPWVLVDSVPGITSPGLAYQLLPKLWAFLPTEPNPEDGSLLVPSPADIPIIEAYLKARLVFYRATSQRPIDLDDPGWAETYTEDGVSRYRKALAGRIETGQAVEFDSGVVLRPYVTGDDRTDTTAIVFDCELDGSVWRDQDGRLSEDSILGVIDDGLAVTAELVGDAWRIEQVGDQPGACL